MTSQSPDNKDMFSLQCVRGSNADGEPCYAYVVIDREAKSAFKNMIARGETNFEQFGMVVREGIGEPTEAIRQEVLAEILKDGETLDDNSV